MKSNAHLNPNGVGLGLSICKKICQKLTGDIIVNSEPGHGTKFTFYVASELSASSTAAPQGRNMVPGVLMESRNSRSTGH